MSLKFGLEPAIGIFIQQQFNNFQLQLNNFQQQFQQQQLAFQEQLDRRLARMEATNANTRIMSLNRYLSPLRPLRKFVSFSSCYAVHLQNSNSNPLD